MFDSIKNICYIINCCKTLQQMEKWHIFGNSRISCKNFKKFKKFLDKGKEMS